MMETPKPKLVVFDLDGTLAASKSPVTSDMGGLLAQLLEKMPVAAMSGARFAQFEKQLVSALPPHAKKENFYLFPTNAATCYNFRDGAWQQLYNNAFTPDERERAMQALKDSLEEVHFENPPQLWGAQIEERGGVQITFSALGQQAPVKEKLEWDPTREKRMPLYKALVRRLPEFAIGLNAATSIDITHKGITKAYGVRKLVELTNIPVADMLYVGDALGPGGNDSVVIETGIQTHEVTGPEEVAVMIKKLLAS